MITVLACFALLIAAFLILFCLTMLWDAWRYSETSWFFFLVVFTFIPLIYAGYFLFSLSGASMVLSLTGGVRASKSIQHLGIALLLYSLIPFLGAVIYYHRKVVYR
jgi:hypothetical protein